ncbi:MAG: zinc ribbon-containing protein [Gammaproteobacteria bacterium]|nr:zinc ribbon-containing protein [Gammaproteobacteria bacterium]
MTKSDDSNRLVAGYQKLMEFLHEKPQIEHALDRLSEWGELTREEVDKVGDYLKRDLEDAANFMEINGKELKDWLSYDFYMVEGMLGETFSKMVDETRETLGDLEEEATRIGEWHTGEIVGLGTFQCKECGEVIHFHKPGHMPPCPKCHGSKYRRLTTSDSD